MLLYSITVSKYFDLAIAGVIGLNVITMALEFYLMPKVGLSVSWLFTSYLLDSVRDAVREQGVV